MPLTREEEEHQRVSRALENVERWKEKYGGFSGGVRVSYSNGPTFEAMIGDPVLAKKVTAGPFDMPKPADPVVIIPTPMPPDVPAIPSVPPPRRSWFARLLNLFSVEK